MRRGTSCGRVIRGDAVTGAECLFDGLADQPVPPAAGRGMPRLRQPERNQPGWQIAALDDLVDCADPVRAAESFIGTLGLGRVDYAVRARQGVPGRAPPAP